MDKFFQNGLISHFKHVPQEVGNFEAVVLYFVVTGRHDNTEAFGGLGFV